MAVNAEFSMFKAASVSTPVDGSAVLVAGVVTMASRAAVILPSNRIWPLAVSWKSPMLVATSLRMRTPAPTSLDTSRMLSAYMPPKAPASIVQVGTAPSPVTALEPVTLNEPSKV